MAFPTVQSTASSVEASAPTSHTVDLPGSISTGDFLLVFFGVALPDGVTVTWPTGDGWAELAWAHFDGGGDAGVSVGYKEADGGEGSTITVTTNTGTNSCHLAYRITGHEDPSTQVPEATTASNSNSQIDTPDLTPTGGAKDYLWFSAGGKSVGNELGVMSAPTNYTNLFEHADGGGSAGIHTIASRRELNASSENPGAYSGGAATAEWGGVTVAIHPAGDEAAGITRPAMSDEEMFATHGGVIIR